MDRDVSIYRDYLIARYDPKISIGSVIAKYHMNRNTFYDFIKRVESGNVERVEVELKKARLDVLWKYRYRVRYLSLPRNRKVGNITKIRQIIKDMVEDKFPVAEIARRFGKHHTTIMHHLGEDNGNIK